MRLFLIQGVVMKQIRLLAQYYVDLMVKLGLVRFSLLLASALVVLAMIVQMAVTMVLRGHVESIDVVRSVFFGLLITPWAVYVADTKATRFQRLAGNFAEEVQRQINVDPRTIADAFRGHTAAVRHGTQSAVCHLQNLVGLLAVLTRNETYTTAVTACCRIIQAIGLRFFSGH